MVLQADVAVPRMSFESFAEFVRRAVGPFVRLRESVEIDRIHLLTVEDHGDEILVARNVDVIPLAGGLRGVNEDG